jgi:putative ABC transport system permease protein
VIPLLHAARHLERDRRFTLAVVLTLALGLGATTAVFAVVYLTFLLLACATGVALLLGTVGLYGVMSYVVALRTREIGVRLALGAQPREIVRSVCRQGLAVASVGIGVVLAGALMLTRFLASLVFEVNTTDPVVLAASAIGLLLIAAIATWLPARKAASIDPSLTLRSL